MKQTNKIFDALLVLQYQSGSKKAIALLVKRWHKKLCRQAYWYTQDLEIAKDIVQDSWSTIVLKIHTLKDPNSFGSWVLTIVTRNAINWQRKHKKELENLNSYSKDNLILISSDTDVSHEHKIRVVLKEAIKKLSNDQQIVLTLFYVEGYSVKQISKIVNVSAGTVKSRLFTAREKLKTIINNRKYEE